MNKINQIIELLTILYNRNYYVKGSDIADYMNISERSVRRLIEELALNGYDIEGKRGKDGGYRLSKVNIVLPVVITKEYQSAFNDIVTYVKGADLPQQKLSAELLSLIGMQSQLEQALPMTVYSNRRLLPQVMLKINTTYQILQEAMRLKRRVVIKYRGMNQADQTLEEREFRPQQFQSFNNTLYIKGYYNSDSSSFRILRLSRFEDIRMIDKKYSFNLDFDDDDNNAPFSKDVYQEYKLVLHINKNRLDILEYQYGHQQTITETADYFELTFLMSGVQYIRELILAMGNDVEVISPVSIRDDIKQQIINMANKY